MPISRHSLAPSLDRTLSWLAANASNNDVLTMLCTQHLARALAAAYCWAAVPWPASLDIYIAAGNVF